MSYGYPERLRDEFVEMLAKKCWRNHDSPLGESGVAAGSYLAAVDAWRAKASTAPACGPFPCPRCGVLGCTERPVYVAYPATPIDPGTGKPYVSRCACQPYGTQYIVVDGKCSGCGEKLRPKPAEPERTCEEILDAMTSDWSRVAPDRPAVERAKAAHRAEVSALKAQVAERDKRIAEARVVLNDYEFAPTSSAGVARRILEGRES